LYVQLLCLHVTFLYPINTAIAIPCQNTNHHTHQELHQTLLSASTSKSYSVCVFVCFVSVKWVTLANQKQKEEEREEGKKREGTQHTWGLRNHHRSPFVVCSRHVSQTARMITTIATMITAEGTLQVMRIEGVGLLSLVLTGKHLLSLLDSMPHESVTLSTKLRLETQITNPFFAALHSSN